ncbi:sulfur oxidation c-type cytochrome SoxX [Pseudomonadales bacterium]|jgi:sulfur-oxidizing protein SoxX|nr:sulfur oxidation c-type cytochrome SoxX [Pseudomonadales bacterium]|tara:strand:- start:7477 stop:7956 length:480 start_codon:yes stop_codon:yes gene_type:complete
MLKPLVVLSFVCGVTLVSSCSVLKSSPTTATTPDNYRIVNDEIPLPLAPISADLKTGMDIFVKREAGHCVLCHQINGLDAPFQGNLGPDLSEVGSRLTPAQIRFRIADASRLNPATVMPPYYRINDLSQVLEEVRGKPVLSADNVEQLVYFLSMLQGAE